MDTGFDSRTLALNHVFVVLWTVFFFPGGNPLSLLDGNPSTGALAVLALWTVAVAGLLAMDALVAYRLLTER
jgi:hypothetical protein